MKRYTRIMIYLQSVRGLLVHLCTLHSSAGVERSDSAGEKCQTRSQASASAERRACAGAGRLPAVCMTPVGGKVLPASTGGGGQESAMRRTTCRGSTRGMRARSTRRPTLHPSCDAAHVPKSMPAGTSASNIRAPLAANVSRTSRSLGDMAARRRTACNSSGLTHVCTPLVGGKGLPASTGGGGQESAMRRTTCRGSTRGMRARSTRRPTLHPSCDAAHVPKSMPAGTSASNIRAPLAANVSRTSRSLGDMAARRRTACNSSGLTHVCTTCHRAPCSHSARRHVTA